MLDHQLLFFFSAIGVFNALLLCVYLVFGIAQKNTKHYLLTSLLLMFCIRVGVSCIYFFEKNLSPHWIQLGLTANFMVGPLVWSFVQLSLAQQHQLTTKTKIHLWGNLIFIIGFGILYNFQENYQVWDHQIRYLIHCQLTIYLILTAFQLVPVIKKTNNIQPKEWAALSVFFIVLLISLGFVVSLYTSYVLGPVFTSLLFYVLVLIAIFKRSQIAALFSPTIKYNNKKIDPILATKLITQLEQLMQKEKLYKNALLKLDVIAKKMRITDNQLSQLLNDNIGKNYAAYINEYRIQAAKELLLRHPKMTIESIGYEVGYNAKASFYTTFKRQTGMTPAAFKKQFSDRSSKN